MRVFPGDMAAGGGKSRGCSALGVVRDRQGTGHSKVNDIWSVHACINVILLEGNDFCFCRNIVH
ncbi:hypothetical protein E2C01_031953 [Portunus trituberculatus]|uniref:Uncharacterized protein n=1 Tax=Portunus trituberculatus TaxID=210409 RepID=A0A5B7EZ92_PORTR|nr:hypothetical protein [Portunus trituberculatus]